MSKGGINISFYANAVENFRIEHHVNPDLESAELTTDELMRSSEHFMFIGKLLP